MIGPATALVPGDPDAVAWLAREYGRYAAGACDAARALRRIDTGAWVGPAGDAFRSAIGEVPAKLERGQSAFARASAALSDHARVLRDAQADAAAAVHRYAEADAATASWRGQVADHQAAVAQAVAAKTAPPSGGPPSWDPGDDGRAAAEHLLAAARERVDAAARRAAAVLDDARRGAPHEPGLLSKALHAAGSFFRGAGEATWGLAELGFRLSPTYALVDPAGFVDNAEQMGKGLVYGVEHPKELGKAVIDYDTWTTDPARALGHLVPDLLLAVATAGAGEAGAAGGRIAEGAEAAGRLARGAEVAEELTGRGAAAAAREAGLSEEVATALEERFGSPTEGANRFQSQGLYVGRDRWVDRILMEGDTFSIGYPGEGQFAAAPDAVEAVGTDARAYYEGVQGAPRDMGDGVATYRSHLRTYTVKRPMPVAESIAEANPRFGAGGLRQYFIPDEIDRLIAEGWVSEPVTTPMTNLVARIPEEGLAVSTQRAPSVAGRAMMTGATAHSARELATTGGCR